MRNAAGAGAGAPGGSRCNAPPVFGGISELTRSAALHLLAASARHATDAGRPLPWPAPQHTNWVASPQT